MCGGSPWEGQMEEPTLRAGNLEPSHGVQFKVPIVNASRGSRFDERANRPITR